MHDPKTVAFEIKNYLSRGRRLSSKLDGTGPKYTYRDPLITIWHNDPEKDGTDDSCGWFKRARHGDKAMLEEIRKAFEFNWDASYGGWFDAKGKPLMSAMGITLQMFHTAAWHHFRHNRRATDRFMRQNLHTILSFAENTTDSLHPSITGKYGKEPREERIEHFASVIYGYILRLEQPWYRHARWHVWHWSLQVHPWQTFRRWAFDRCSICKGRFGWKESAYGSWGGGAIWHGRCDQSSKPAQETSKTQFA